MARSENSKAYKALLSRIAPPEVVVTDGGAGFQKARHAIWSKTQVQRCTFHAFHQVKRYTTAHPKTQAGVDLYVLARDLLRVVDAKQAAKWLVSFAQWCSAYESFLAEMTTNEKGQIFPTHQRLIKARDALLTLIRQKTLFTFTDPDLVERLGKLPATNNALESTNTQIRTMLKEH